jgi:hypothetical protein
MAPLPDFRIPSEGDRIAPFEVAAMDVAGPLSTKVGRGRALQKRWVLVLRCAKMSAVHFELLADLSCDAFLRAFHRFLSVRPKPKKLVCDNATNFKAANKVIMGFLTDDSISDYLTEVGLEFDFSPPDAPHFNGLVERIIGMMKKALKKSIPEDSRLTDEEFSTLLAEIMRIFNNRPIGLARQRSVKDLLPITPSHFLGNGDIWESIIVEEDNLSKRYYHLRLLIEKFWGQFIDEMKPHLMTQERWHQRRRQVQVGDVVYVLEEGLSAKFRLGLITKTQSDSRDGLTRRISVRCNGKEYIRSLNRICVLIPKEERNLTP